MLLAYVVAGGFLVPLGAGIPDVKPIVFRPDSVYTFTVNAYNAHFATPGSGKVQFWFKNGFNYYCPQQITVVDNNTAILKFGVSSSEMDSLTRGNFDVVANNDIDGTFALRDATSLIRKAGADTVAGNPIPLVKCEPVVLYNKSGLFVFPFREILLQTIRNTFFHVPMWFAMTIMVMLSLVSSLFYLIKRELRYDVYASRAIVIAILFGLCGYFTGALWSKYTWFIGLGWEKAIRNMVYEDIKLAGALIAIAIYAAYFIVRALQPDPHQRARLSAVYSIFSLVMFMLVIYVLPRLTDSMHPGNGGNPAFSKYDLDSTLRMFFYPAVIGWILLSMWLFSILVRLKFIEEKTNS